MSLTQQAGVIHIVWELPTLLLLVLASAFLLRRMPLPALAVLLGGDFSAGPRPDGGFRVAARLPVPALAR